MTLYANVYAIALVVDVPRSRPSVGPAPSYSHPHNGTSDIVNTPGVTWVALRNLTGAKGVGYTRFQGRLLGPNKVTGRCEPTYHKLSRYGILSLLLILIMIMISS